MLRVGLSFVLPGLAAAILAAVLMAVPLRADCGPTAVVEGLHEALLDVMKRADDLGIEGRFQVLEPRIHGTFDFARMMRIAAGARWTGATAAERQVLLDAFSRLSVSTYAARFDGYGGERFETLGERSGPRNTVLVDTRIVRTDAPAVTLTYVVEVRDDRWRVIDVLLDGSISELAMRRSEYRSLGGSSAVGLAEALNAAADAMMAGG